MYYLYVYLGDDYLMTTQHNIPQVMVYTKNTTKTVIVYHWIHINFIFLMFTIPIVLEANLKNSYLVMGWGRTNNKRFDLGDRFSGGAHSNILQQLEVPFIQNELCRSNYTAFQNITSDKQICAGGIKGILNSIG